MCRKNSIAGLIGVLAVLLLVRPSFAASPDLQLVTPRGGQRGAELDLTLRGQRLNDAKEVLFYSPGITVSHLTVQKDGSIVAHLAIAADARVGEYALRLRTATGISDLRTFWVSPYPIVEDTGKTGNRIAARAMPIGLNVTVMGRVQNDQLNYYQVEAKKGQRLSVEVVGMRLGTVVFDPYFQILAADGKKVLLTCDDTVFALADPEATMIVPYDGKYVLAVRESSYSALPDSWFMMHVGTFPRPTVAFPVGGRPGEPLAVKFLGDASGPIAQTISIPADAPQTMDVFAEQDGLIAPTPNRLRIDSCANVISNDTDHSIASAMPISDAVPVALNGILAEPGQRDFYRITAKAHVRLDVRVIARELRSPLDSVLYIYDAAGHQMMVNDDQPPNNPDSDLRFDPPANGQYIVGIVDHLHRGGPEFVYRIEITKAEPSVWTSLAISQINKDAYFETVSVPRGNRFVAVVRIQRNDFDGPIRLTASDLPPGVTMSADPVPPGQNVAPVVFQADADAKLDGKLCQLQAESLDPKKPLTGGFQLDTNLVEFDQAPLHQVRTDRLAVAVTDPAPVTITVNDPKTPLLQDGTMDLHVHVDRQAGFKGPIKLEMPVTPRGLQPARLDIPPDQSDVTLSIGAEPNTPVGKIRVCLRAEFENSGRMTVASNFFTVDVKEPAIHMQLPNLRVAVGNSTTVTCQIVQNAPLSGSANVRLLGLPPGCTADDVSITSADRQAKFTIRADPTCRPGMQPGVFLRISFTQAGEPIVLNLGRGASIRITHAHLQSPGNAPLAAAAAKEGK
jgi:hypothetical protein